MLADDPGTYRWMAPEMIKRKPHGRKADVYSFGLLLWELVAGATPYEDMNPIQAAFAVVDKVKHFDYLMTIFKSFIVQLFQLFMT